MSSAINHKIRSRQGYRKQHQTLAPKQSPMIDMGTPRRKKRRKSLSSLFFRGTVAS